MPNHLHVDPFSGIAGDMFLGALLDLGLSLEELKRKLAVLNLGRKYALTALPVLRQGIGALDLKVVVEGAAEKAKVGGGTPARNNGGRDPGHTHEHAHDHSHSHSHDHGHTHSHDHGNEGTPAAGAAERVGYSAIMKMIDRLALPERGERRARRIVEALARAEARVHRMDVEEVHFHEVGALDSIIDMLGAAIGLEMLDVETVSCGPLPMGRGFVRCDHGKMPLPAPATAYLMEGLPTFGVDRTGELVTPTGAAILVAVVDRFGPPPAMTMRKVGHGAGDRDDPETPNMLRLFLGDGVLHAEPFRAGAASVSRP